MTKDEALKLALEALEDIANETYDSWTNGAKAQRIAQNLIPVIKEALAQPEQTNTRPYYTIDELNAWADEKEKQAWRNAAIRIGEELSSVGPDGYYDMDAWQWLDWAMEQEPRGKNSLAQPEQEPINDGWQITFANGHSGFGVYAHMDEYPEEGSSLLCAVPQWAKEALNKSAYQRGYLDGIGRDCPHCKDYKAMYIKVRDELAAEQQITQQQTARIVDLQTHIENFDGEE